MIYILFFISNTFISKTRLKFIKNQAKAKQHHEAELFILREHSLSLSSSSSKENGAYPKNCAKNKCDCFNKIIWSIIMKMKRKKKNRSDRYYTNRSRAWHWHKYTKYQKSASMMVLIESEHLSNIWSLIYEKIKQQWGWVEKKRYLCKKMCS